MQLGDPFHREVLALHRDEHRVGGGEPVDGEESERWRGIDEDVVVLAGDCLERAPKVKLATDGVGELELRADEIDRRWREWKFGSSVGTITSRMLIPSVSTGYIDFSSSLRDPDARGGIRLRIEIDEEDVSLAGRQRRGQIDGCRRLSDAPLLIRERNDLAHDPMFHVERNDKSTR